VEYDWKFEGEIFNNSAVISIYKKEYNFSSNSYEYKKNNRGLLFYSQGDELIKYIDIDDAAHLKRIYTLTKIS